MTFKEYINEGTSKNILSKISNRMIPISPKAMERIFEIKNEYYLHSLSYEEIKTLKKLQNTKKTVSCFNSFTTKDIFSGADGIDLDSPVLAVLKGSYTIKANEDIYTSMDKQGRRWIDQNIISNDALKKIFKEISSTIEKDFIKTTEFKDLKIRDIHSITSINLTGLQIKDIISTYMDISEKVIKSYKKDIDKVFNIKTTSYNEILGYNFKIEKLLMLEEHLTYYHNYLEEHTKEEIQEIAKKEGITLVYNTEELIKTAKRYL